MKKDLGVVAAGHEMTVRVAEDILKSGGNAFDAAVAAHIAACVTEPVLSSPAGGGFLMAQTPHGNRVLYDFFTQTPLNRHGESVEFYPISADFGETQQEFHIGMGACATPGMVKGLFAIHDDLCTMPMKRLVEPAVKLARDGVSMNYFQSYILDIVKPIFQASEESLRIYGRTGTGSPPSPSAKTSSPGDVSSTGHTSSSQDASSSGGAPSTGDTSSSQNTSPSIDVSLLQEGDILHQPEFADFLEVLAVEGEAFFYRGEIAQMVDRMSRESGGQLRLDDFHSYRVVCRRPLTIDYRDSQLAINPPPGSGGTLIAFALRLMEETGNHSNRFGSSEHLLHLARIQQLTDIARLDQIAAGQTTSSGASKLSGTGLLDSDNFSRYARKIKQHPRFYRGTTHISIMDHQGNTAALTTSNGEGCGHIIPGTGIMLNNMLGEEDLHPEGFENWPDNRRITSMMAPGVLNMPDGSVVALGSGGSKRLRTAILQVILNLTDHKMRLKDAVQSPRIHCEKDFLSVEHGFDAANLEPLLKTFPSHKLWSGSNLFFGGVHSVMNNPAGFQGAGDSRRGGVARVVR